MVQVDSHEFSKQCGMEKMIILKDIIVDSRNIAERVLAVIFRITDNAQRKEHPPQFL